jgi:DNA-binding NtrC family response regulator
MKRNIKEISIDAMQALQNYSWVGNVRELENVIERCVVLITGNVVKAKDIPASILTKSFYLGEHEEADWARFTYREAKMRAISLFNKSYIRNLLKETGGNISLASNKAGLDRSNLKKIIKKYDIDLGEFRRGT